MYIILFYFIIYFLFLYYFLFRGIDVDVMTMQDLLKI